jgi:translation elongation factor EF-Tu-like GTPase
MDLDQFAIRACIELIATSDGGRHSPLRGPLSYRPNHNFFGEANREMCIGTIDLSEGQTLAPGEAMEVGMVLLAWPALTQAIQVGRRWRMQEGARFVGWGTVLELIGG